MAMGKEFYGDKMLEKLPFGKERGQGAVEYLLILAAVLVVVAVAVYYVIGVGKGPEIVGNATLSDNVLVFTPSTGLSPDPMTYSWEWAVYSDDTEVIAFSSTNTTDMEIGVSITLDSGATNVSHGDQLRIRCEGKLFRFDIP
ncbi:MAG: class III signal peptide-containing protein [Candidatus Hadarchaeota archaeon]|nr:class III signal peptide-containing protein [Candidatus Hadarchaeota archaeon]